MSDYHVKGCEGYTDCGCAVDAVATLRARVASLEAAARVVLIYRPSSDEACVAYDALRAALAPRSERRDGEPATFVRCKRCGGSGRMGNPHIIDGWPVRCSECRGSGITPPAAPKEEA